MEENKDKFLENNINKLTEDIKNMSTYKEFITEVQVSYCLR